MCAATKSMSIGMVDATISTKPAGLHVTPTSGDSSSCTGSHDGDAQQRCRDLIHMHTHQLRSEISTSSNMLGPSGGRKACCPSSFPEFPHTCGCCAKDTQPNYLWMRVNDNALGFLNAIGNNVESNDRCLRIQSG
jgi:hypothetical protein